MLPTGHAPAVFPHQTQQDGLTWAAMIPSRIHFTRICFTSVVICLALSFQPVRALSEANSLGKRIAEYSTSHTRTESACDHPILVVEDHRIKVVRFDVGYREDYMKPEGLSDYLEKIPLSAWPKGPKIWVNRADFHPLHPGESADKALQSQQAQFGAAIQILKGLGLTPTNKQGISY